MVWLHISQNEALCRVEVEALVGHHDPQFSVVGSLALRHLTETYHSWQLRGKPQRKLVALDPCLSALFSETAGACISGSSSAPL